MDWATLFQRAAAHEVTVETVTTTLAARRDRGENSASEAGDGDG